jgi:hypothetical protein
LSAETSRDGIEGENAYRVFVPALEQIHDHDLEVGCLTVGFAPDPAKPAQIVHHQIDIMVIPTGDDRRGPVGSTHCKTFSKNRGFKRSRADSFLSVGADAGTILHNFGLKRIPFGGMDVQRNCRQTRP